MNIVVVESPAKAKTINKYLGPGYEVLASFGHVRDLPAKDGSVDPEHDFRMIWEVDDKSQKRLNDIARAVKGADKLILATDPDREGEAISWHVLEVLKEQHALKKQAVERVVFNAITKQAVLDAMKHPRSIDAALVDAYLARRALDYLVGFTLSPVLWRKLPGRALGRPRAVGGAAAGLRPRARDREVRRRANTGRWWRRSRRRAARPSRRASSAPTARRSSASTSARAPRPKPSSRRWRARPSRSPRRGQARQAQPAAALHHLDAAAGGEPQARLRARPHHADRAAALRRRRHRRRDRRPHHLYAHRRRATSPKRRSPPPASLIGADYGEPLRAAAPRQYQTKAKNAQEAHEAIRPTDLARAARRTRQRSSIPTRPGSTS